MLVYTNVHLVDLQDLVGAAAHDVVAVPGHTEHLVLVHRGQRVERNLAPRVPHLDRAVVGARRQQVARWMPRHRRDPTAVRYQLVLHHQTLCM